MNQKDINNIRTEKKHNNFINTLPKANEIFDFSQQMKKGIYPFLIKCRRNNIINAQQQPYQSLLSSSRFKPPRESVLEHFNSAYIIYDKFNNNKDNELFNANIFSIERLKNLKNIDYVINVEFTKAYQNPKAELRFDSRFQSGNLSYASFVQDVYCLLLHNDVNTSGYTNWFYFSVNNKSKGTYKFAIMNYGKAGWPFNHGVKICTYEKEKGWQRKGKNINCQQNRKLYQKQSSMSNFNTLYFQYEFEQEETQVYFAFNIPYTYTDLFSFLNSINERQLPYYHQKLVGLSLAGNRLQLLTITNFQLLKNGADLPVIVLLARSHPGETVSSWVIHNFIQFLISDEAQAQSLRDNFIFKIFPMINPDGVVHGNYRCSLSGRDLNRRWIEASKNLFPQVYYIKNQITEISKNRTIKMVIDLHGHSQLKKVFAYGCNDKFEPHKCRLFPYMVSKVTNYFQFKYCSFYIDKSKLSTARVTLFNYLKIPHIFTIETSQFGTMDGHHSGKVFFEVGRSIGAGMLLLFHIKSKEQENEGEKLENQFMNDTSLIKVGTERDPGSDSEPSVDNIRYEKLEKLANRKERKINSNVVQVNRMTKSTHKPMIQTYIQKRKMSQNMKITTVNRTLRTSKDCSFNSAILSEAPRMIRTADGGRTSSIQRKITYEDSFQKRIQKKLVSPKPQKRKQAVKMINFSLSINEVRPKQIFSRYYDSTPLEWKINSGGFGVHQRFILRNNSQASKR